MFLRKDCFGMILLSGLLALWIWISKSVQIWELLSHYLFKLSPSLLLLRFQWCHRLFLLMVSHKPCTHFSFFFSFCLNNFKWSVFKLIDLFGPIWWWCSLLNSSVQSFYLQLQNFCCSSLSVVLGVNWGCLFDAFLVSWVRVVLLQTSLLELLFLHPIGFELSCFHCHFFLESFRFPFLFLQ